MKKTYWKKYYHGTDKKTADLIMKNGFKRGSFFATHMEDAVGYGGNYVFEVSIRLPYDHTYWEYVTPVKIPARQIMRLFRFNTTEIYKNEKLGNRMFKFNLKQTLGPKKYRSHMAKCGAAKRYMYAKSQGK